MDSLSKLISMLQLDTTIEQRCIFDSDFAVDHPEVKGNSQSYFHVVIQGKCDVWIESVKYSLGQGTFIILPRGKAHILSNGDNVLDGKITKTGLNVNVFTDSTILTKKSSNHDSDVVCDILCGKMSYSDGAGVLFIDKLPDVMILNLHEVVEHGFLNLIAHNIRVEASGIRSGSNAIINSLVQTLFAYALRSYIDQTSDFNWLTLILDRRLSVVVSKIINNPEYKWSLESLASAASMSRANFAKRFKEISRITPFEFVTSIRIMRAINLLANTNNSIIDISTKCGYQSESSFNKVFQEKIGITPGKWRKKALIKDNQVLSSDQDLPSVKKEDDSKMQIN